MKPKEFPGSYIIFIIFYNENELNKKKQLSKKSKYFPITTHNILRSNPLG